MATYEPFGALSVVQWVLFAVMIVVFVILVRLALKHLRDSIWYFRKSSRPSRPRLERIELGLDELWRNLAYVGLALGSLGVIIWEALPFPILMLVSLGGPFLYILLSVLVILCLASLLAAFIAWLVMLFTQDRIKKTDEPIDEPDVYLGLKDGAN